MPRKMAAINEASRRHGERIRKTRLGLGMTQAELAEIFGVWRETICRIECGHFDILQAWPKYRLLNERMRIWAEMNKGGRKRTYKNCGYRLRKESTPESLAPRTSYTRKHWEPINQAMKEKRRKRKNERENT